MNDRSPKRTILLTGGVIVTMNPAGEVLRADIRIEGDRIAAIGHDLPPAERVLDAAGCTILPGFVQTHVHLCQTLFRNQADDLPLLQWLAKRIWPLEAAHDESSMRAAARLGIAELLRGGTTCILDMGTLRHTDVLFATAEELGIRAVIGKSMMDAEASNPHLHEPLQQSIAETERLARQWHGSANGRLRYAVSPRFAVGCSQKLLCTAAELARERGLLLHTHASETTAEVELVRARAGVGNVQYLHALGFIGPDVCLAHCVWVNEEEQGILADSGTNVLHCPSANLKLGSGIAPVPELLARGARVSLGADGAPCNNNLSIFREMRLASLIQKPRLGPQSMPAETVLRLATIEGARALGLGNEIGSVEVGKKADLVVVRSDRPHQVPQGSLLNQIVYATTAADVWTVLVDGRIVVEEGRLTEADEEEIVRDACEQVDKLLARVHT